MTGIYKIIRFFLQESKKFSFSLQAIFHTSVTTCQRMKTSRLFISLYKYIIAGFQIKDLILAAAFIQNFQYIRKLLKALSAPDIYSKSCFIHLRTRHRQKFCKFRNQWDRQIIYTKISHIFQHLKCCTFSGTGHSSHNYKSHLIRPLISSLPVPDPRRNSPSRGSVPVSSVP